MWIKSSKLLSVLGLLSLLALAWLSSASAQDLPPTAPAPTLVPPTLVPTAPADVRNPADYSGIATVREENLLRVGTRYNVPPFSYLDNNGVLRGYEVDVIEALAVELGIRVEWVQVTGETEQDDLIYGRVDALIGEQVHSREAEQWAEFSHPYYLNQQRIVVLESAPYQSFNDLNGMPISVLPQSKAEVALQIELRSGRAFDVRHFYTEREALDALENGEVQAMAGEWDDLNRAGRQGMRYIEQPLRLDPYGIVVRRYDVNLRNALNRGIQRLFASGRLEQIYDRWFDSRPDNYFDVLLPVYNSIFDDPRAVTDFNPDMPRPQRSLVEAIRQGETIRVSGLSLSPDATTYERLLDPFNQALMSEIAIRIGASFDFIPNSSINPEDYMADGRAQIAIGVTPRWDGADRFDYSRPYAATMNRVMVLEGSRFQSFNDFRGGSYMGYWYEDAPARAEIERIAAELNVNTTVYEFRSVQEIVDQFNERNVDGIFADTRRLRAIVELTRSSGLPWDIRPEAYSRAPITIALPRNDANLRSLIDWTLQDMFLDGTYQRIYNETYGEGEPLIMLTWPGDGSWLLGQ